MAREAQGRRALGPRHALFGAGSVLLLCALIGHTATMVWQVAGPGGVLVDYATRRAEAEAALDHHSTRQGVLLGAGLSACALSLVLGRRARRSRPGGDVDRAASNRISRGETR